MNVAGPPYTHGHDTQSPQTSPSTLSSTELLCTYFHHLAKVSSLNLIMASKIPLRPPIAVDEVSEIIRNKVTFTDSAIISCP